MKAQTVILPKEEKERRAFRIQRIASFLTDLDPKKVWQVVIEPYRRERTNQQNRYLRGVCAKLLSEHTGYEVDEVYEFLLGSYFGWKTRRCPKTPSNPKGVEDVPVRSTTRNETGDREVLKDQDFWAFVEWIQRFGASVGVLIPDPDPNYWQREDRHAA